MKRDPVSEPARALPGPIVIAALAILGFVVAGRRDTYTEPGQLNAAFWPRTIFVLLILACMAKSWSQLSARRISSIGSATIAEAEEPPAETDPRKLWAGIALIVGFVAGIELIGFALACFLFLLGFIYLGGWRGLLSLAGFSLAGTVVMLYVFVKVVYLPLPKGLGVFEDVTVALYRVLRIF